MKIEVSTGEILDKYSILMIKKDHIKDKTKLENIQKEIDELLPIVNDITKNRKDHTATNLYIQLVIVNRNLWDIEDDIRECERQKDFGDKFVQLARSVYIKNDQRANIKKEINLLTNSGIVEEKSYESY
jgi:hypothetical protein